MKFRSIKTKVLFYFGGITIVLLALFNFTLYQFLEQNVKLSIKNDLYHKAVFINNAIVSNVPIKELLDNKEVETFEVAVVKEGKILYQKGNANFDSLIPYIEKRESFFVFSRADKLDGLYLFRIYKPYKGAILFYEKNVDEKITSKLQEIKEILFVLEPILFLLLLFMVSKVTDKILQSINKITTTANQIYVTDFSFEIPPPKYDDEIKDLVDSFNQMIKRLKDGVQLLEQFNSDVSHELKTPLTVIRSEIELTLNKKRDQEYYERTLTTVEKETVQIQTIVDNLLLLTKYTKDNIKQTFQKTSIDSSLLNVIEKFTIILKEKNIKLHIQRLEPIEKDVNHVLVTTIFTNLLDNAIKYSLKNTNIYLYLYKEKKVHFTIRDEGIGISSENLEKVQNRFFRVDESRNKKIKGFGLGLSLVKNSIDLHDGIIEIKSKEGIGTTINVVL